MDLEVCRDLLAVLSRTRCEKPTCGCNPRDTMMTNFAIITGEPLDALVRLLANANVALRRGDILPASFENGLMMGFAIAMASDHPDLRESIKAASELNPDLKQMLQGQRPQ